MESVQASVMHRLIKSQADSTNIAFPMGYVLSIQKGSGNTPISNYQNTNRAKQYTHEPWNSRNVASNITKKSTSSPTKRHRHRLLSPPTLEVHAVSISTLAEVLNRALYHHRHLSSCRSELYATTLTILPQTFCSLRTIHPCS